VNDSKIITAAASSYIPKEFNFSPGSTDKFKVFEASTATAELGNLQRSSKGLGRSS
jgi:hypothetical protein